MASSRKAEGHVKEMLESMLFDGVDGKEWDWHYTGADGNLHSEVFLSPSEFLINRIAYFAGDKEAVDILWQYRVEGATRRPTTVKTRYALPDTYTFALACVCKYDDKGEDPSLLIALEKALEDAVVAHSKQIQITSGPTVDFQTGSLNSYTITWRLEVDAR